MGWSIPRNAHPQYSKGTFAKIDMVAMLFARYARIQNLQRAGLVIGLDHDVASALYRRKPGIRLWNWQSVRDLELIKIQDTDLWFFVISEDQASA